AHEARRLFLSGESHVSMYALVRSGARSYHVEEGSTITIDRRAGQAGDTVTFDQVLLVADGGRGLAGTPLVSDAKVPRATVGVGKDHTLFALVAGTVEFKAARDDRRRVSVVAG